MRPTRSFRANTSNSPSRSPRPATSTTFSSTATPSPTTAASLSVSHIPRSVHPQPQKLTNIADEFSNQNGNPWADKHNTLDAGNGCSAFDCKPNDKNCYSQGGKTVYHCPTPVNLTAKICL